jgi:hypothetical protein
MDPELFGMAGQNLMQPFFEKFKKKVENSVKILRSTVLTISI